MSLLPPLCFFKDCKYFFLLNTKKWKNITFTLGCHGLEKEISLLYHVRNAMIEVHTTNVHENRGGENMSLPEWHTIENLLEKMAEKKKYGEWQWWRREYFRQKEMSENLAWVAGQ